MTKKSKQKFKYLEDEKSFQGKMKSIFIFFKGLSVAKDCHRPESAPLKHFPEKYFRGYCECIGIYLNFVGQGLFSRIFKSI